MHNLPHDLSVFIPGTKRYYLYNLQYPSLWHTSSNCYYQPGNYCFACSLLMVERLGERNERVTWSHRNSSRSSPQGISSSKNISSVHTMTGTLQSLKETIKHINPGYVNNLCLVSLLTLIVEHLFSKMQSRNPTPTVLEYTISLVQP